MRFPILTTIVVATLGWNHQACTKAEETNASEAETCGLYLAVSSTSTAEETNWGLYSGRELAPRVSVGFPDVGINMINLRAHGVPTDAENDRNTLLSRTVDFLESFVWVPDPAGAKFEVQNGKIITAIAGAGVLGGFNVKLTNANWKHSAAYRRPRLEHENDVEKNHPGRGASTPFYNVMLESSTEISQGSEIFVDYGDNWEDEDKEHELTKDEYKKLDETVVKMVNFFEKHKEELDADSKQEIFQFLMQDVLSAAIGPDKAHKVGTLLPTVPDELPRVVEAGGSLAYSDPTIYRKLEWLDEHGRCMDNIKAGASNISYAGRGAMATRAIKQGSLVAPVPLIQVPDRAVFNMYNLQLSEDGETYIRTSDDIVGEQMIINYSFGHKDSSLVFVPAGAIVNLINHGDTPNAKMVWSTHPSHRKMWLNFKPETLLDDEQMYTGLLMEIVATRDIEPGEEILLDYGPEWKAAWDAHVESWKGRLAKGEISETRAPTAVDLNTKYSEQPYPSESEFAAPENVCLKASLSVEESDATGTLENPKTWATPDEFANLNPDTLVNMHVVESRKVEDEEDGDEPFRYVVKWANNNGELTFVKEVPHSAIAFVDMPGMSDAFTEGAFRHVIGIPDDIFPKAWRNRK
jgi:hypothetical protein